MSVEAFLRFVKINTKLCSFMPMIIALAYELYIFGELKVLDTILFMISMLFIDMATTGLNNFMDYKKAIYKDGNNYKVFNAVVRYNISEKLAVSTIVILYVIGIIFGVALCFIQGWIGVLTFAIGCVSFVVAITYSAGPIPVSHTPYGEIISGFVMGYFIFVVTIYTQLDMNEYIRVVANSIELNNISGNVVIDFKFITLMIKIFFLSLPVQMTIANIMLANNLCGISKVDQENDLKNRRYTLPYYLGAKNALKLYEGMFIVSVILILIYGILGWIPLLAGIISLLYMFTSRYKTLLNKFLKEQGKLTTFETSVHLFFDFTMLYFLGIFIPYLFKLFMK